MSRSILPLSSPSKYFLWMDEKRRWNLPGGQYRREEREDGLTEVKPIRTRGTVQSSRFRDSGANAGTNLSGICEGTCRRFLPTAERATLRFRYFAIFRCVPFTIMPFTPLAFTLD